MRDPDTYSVVIFTSAMHATLGGGADITGAEPERLAKIFLEDADGAEDFVRALAFEAVPFEPEEVMGKRKIMFMASAFLLRFSRYKDDGAPLVTSLTQKLRVRLPTDVGVLEFIFKPKDLGVATIEDRSQPLQTCWLQFRTEECVPVAILLPSSATCPTGPRERTQSSRKRGFAPSGPPPQLIS